MNIFMNFIKKFLKLSKGIGNKKNQIKEDKLLFYL